MAYWMYLTITMDILCCYITCVDMLGTVMCVRGRTGQKQTPMAWQPTPDSNIHGAKMGPIWGRQDPGGPHVGLMSFAIWDTLFDYGSDKEPLEICKTATISTNIDLCVSLGFTHLVIRT